MIDLKLIKQEELKNIKLIAIDIDGTLLDDNKNIPEENIEAIKKATLANIKIVLSSGRPLAPATIDMYDKLGLLKTGNYFIAYNGESVYDVISKKAFYTNPLDKNDVIILDSYFSSLNINFARYVHLDENVTVINPNKYSLLEKEYNFKDHVEGDFLKIKNLGAHKYQIADYPDIISHLYNNLPKWLKDKYDVVITMPCFLEVTKKGVNKYNTILKLCNFLGIKENEVMTIGDSMNDYLMIKNCQYGVAMGNAVSSVKEVSKIITLNNNDCGVSKAIYLCLNN